MRKSSLFILPLIILLASCNQPTQTKVENTNTATAVKPSFDWLLGNWIRINEKDNKQTFEQWEKISETEYAGLGFTMLNKDTVWMEAVRLVDSADNWSFDVTEKGGVTPTKFKLTTIEQGKFVCENQANEFPKIIAYESKGDTLHAKINGGDMEIVFDFIKQP